MKSLLEGFHQLSEAEKLVFFKTIMPELCSIFRKDPKKMMAEMKPLCQEMMQGCDFDPQQMMRMMGQGEKSSGQ
jgi:hypothetical protein